MRSTTPRSPGPCRRRRARASLLLLAGVGVLSAASAGRGGTMQSPAPPPPSTPATPRPAPEPRPSGSKPFKIEELTWSLDPSGAGIDTLEVRNDFGDIRARFAGAGERRIEIAAVAQRLGPPGPDLAFTSERRGGRVVVSMAIAGRDAARSPEPGKADVDRADLTVFAPEGIALIARTTRGLIQVRGVRGPVEAESLEGSVRVISAGAVTARSGSGDVAVRPGGRGGPIVLRSDAGRVQLTVEKSLELDLAIDSGGPVESDLPLEIREEHGRRRARLRTGAGRIGGLVYTGSGAVRLLKP